MKTVDFQDISKQYKPVKRKDYTHKGGTICLHIYHETFQGPVTMYCTLYSAIGSLENLGEEANRDGFPKYAIIF